MHSNQLNKWTKRNNFPLLIEYVSLISEYTTYAQIEITKNGYRHLLHDNYRFGETKVTDHCVFWRCTANIRDPLNSNRSKRCVTQLTTKIVNGYEMIRNPYVCHVHPPNGMTKKYCRSYVPGWFVFNKNDTLSLINSRIL